MTDPIEGPNRAAADSGDQAKGPIVLRGREGIRFQSQRLAERARRELLILSGDLDPDYYDHVPFIEAVRQLCLRSPHLAVRVLLTDPRAVSLNGHRLIALARQLTSRIAVRRLGDDFKDRQDAFLVADGRAYCVRRLADTPEAVLDLDGPREARLLRAEFEQMWERSHVDSELRRLYL
jgi:hypothetical protein